MRRPLAALLAAAALAGCGGSGEDGIDVSLRVVAADNNIRLEGAECAGARPFEHVHAGAGYALEAADGEVLAEGELPAGTAENADPSIDWGVERIPTVCVMALTLEDVPEREAYRLQLDEGAPMEFDAALLSGTEPLQLVVP
jgi:Prokaryotic membrane lipoprotein lipid attachment site